MDIKGQNTTREGGEERFGGQLKGGGGDQEGYLYQLSESLWLPLPRSSFLWFAERANGRVGEVGWLLFRDRLHGELMIQDWERGKMSIIGRIR